MRRQAYHDLSVYARCALIELLERYNGVNNGMIGLGVRELAKALKCSQGRASKALRELDDAGLVQPMTGGLWKGKRATEWRITFYRCDKTQALPIKKWPPKAYASESTKGHERKHKAPDSSPPKAQSAKTSISNAAKCSVGDAHIDICHDHRLSGIGRACFVERSLERDLPPDHAECVKPSPGSFPPGWHYCHIMKSVVTDTGLCVPTVNDPLVGTAEQRKALEALQQWKSESGEDCIIAEAA